MGASVPNHQGTDGEAVARQITENVSRSTTRSSIIEDCAEDRYPGGWKVALIMIAIYMHAFLIALVRLYLSRPRWKCADCCLKDRTIVATAVPSITDEFHSLADVGWYASAYLLTSCSFQLLWGKLFALYSSKWVYIINVLLFSIGSAMSGAAPTSAVLILGRAISGVGAAGINSGVLVILAHITHPRQRAMCTGFLAAAFGTAATMGPIIGGALTTRANWRWVFWINLPCGLFSIAVIALLLWVPQPVAEKGKRKRTQFLDLDPLGFCLFAPSIIALLIALQWGGSTYPWNSPRIIALLVVFAVLFIAFVGVQLWQHERAIVPPRIIRQRSIAAGFFFSLCVGGSLMLLVYYLPQWFQVVQNATALQSGVNQIAMTGALVFGSLLVRVLITAVGYYAPFMITAAIFMSVGAGLLTTLTTTTPPPNWIGYQILYGVGVGLGMQQSTMAGLTVLNKDDIGIGMGLMFFAQTLGGAVLVSVGQNVFAGRLRANLDGVPGVDAAAVLKSGATAVRKMAADPAALAALLGAYNGALVRVFLVVTVASALVSVGAFAIEWKRAGGKKHHTWFEGALA